MRSYTGKVALGVLKQNLAVVLTAGQCVILVTCLIVLDVPVDALLRIMVKLAVGTAIGPIRC